MWTTAHLKHKTSLNMKLKWHKKSSFDFSSTVRHDSREIEYALAWIVRVRLQLPIDKDCAYGRGDWDAIRCRWRTDNRRPLTVVAICVIPSTTSQQSSWMSLSFIAARSRFIVSGYFLTSSSTSVKKLRVSWHWSRSISLHRTNSLSTQHRLSFRKWKK